MKPALFYSIHNSYGDYRIVAVTTVKRSVWHGRYTDTETGTHGRNGSLNGKFKTAEAATVKIDEIKAITARYREPLEAIRRSEQALRLERDDAIKAVLGSNV